MKIIFAGTGSAFTMRNFQTNLVIQKNGKNLLVDCGGDARHSLAAVGLKAKDIDAVYVTHLHADHVGGLEWLAFATFFDSSLQQRPKLIANSDLMRDLWSFSLRGGLNCIQGRRTGLVDFFDVHAVRPNGHFEWEDITFNVVQSVHVMDGYAIVPSYGLMFDDPDAPEDYEWPWRIFITGDTQFNPNQIKDFYGQAELIIQDCETSPFRTGVHAHYDELKTLEARIKKKMLLVHYQDNILRSTMPGCNDDKATILQETSRQAEQDGFPIVCSTAGVGWYGFVPKGFVLDTSEWFRMLGEPS